MSLVFSAIVPHSPLLIPTIGKDNLKYLNTTIDAYRRLEGELYASKPQTIIVISPHKNILEESFSINLSPRYKSHFDSFGDFSTVKEYTGDIGLIHHIKERLETKIPIKLFSDENLDYGAGVPLYYLTSHLPDPSIVPINFSNLDYKCHYNFGENLKDIILHTNKRIAVLSSADLSHCLLKESPRTYSPEGEKFDKRLIQLLRKKNIQGILRLDPELVNKSGECGFKSILILLGILAGINYEPEVLSYEFPFGIGYLIANFKFS